MVLTGWDWFLLIVATLSIGIGLWRGMIRTVFGLAGWIVAVVATPLLLPIAQDLLNLPGSMWLVVPIFIVLMIVVRLLGSLLSTALGKVGLGGVDRVFGAILGAARALLIVAAIALIAKQFGWHQQAAWLEAQSRPLLDSMVAVLEPLLPDRITGIKRA